MDRDTLTISLAHLGNAQRANGHIPALYRRIVRPDGTEAWQRGVPDPDHPGWYTFDLAEEGAAPPVELRVGGR